MPIPEETAAWATELAETLQPLLSISKDANLEKILEEFIPNSEERIKVTSTLRQTGHTSPKKVAAAALYYGLDIRYGFEEAFKTGNWTPWPDESSEVNCYGQAVATYLVAKRCGLKSILRDFVGFQQENRTQRGSHSFVVVDVGTEGVEEPWVIDQTMNIYGPITLGENSFTVENLDEETEKTYRNDYRRKTFGFTHKIDSNEEGIVAQVEQLREHPESVLWVGQRMGIPSIDAWQSEEKLEAPWYIRFIPKFPSPNGAPEYRGELVSRIDIARPGIKSRGLEYTIHLNYDGTIIEEKVTGYYCESSMVWTDFVKPIPTVTLTPDELRPLLEGLAEIPPKERPAFETGLMNESLSEGWFEYSSANLNTARLQAARRSFEHLQESGNRKVWAFSAVEALYQHEKGSKEMYLTTGERQAAIKKLKDAHNLFRYYAKMEEYRRIYEKRKNRLENRLFNRSRMLRADQQKDPRMKTFLALKTEEERLQHILSHKPTYIDDAVDRLIWYDRKIKGKEAQAQISIVLYFIRNGNRRLLIKKSR